MTNRIDRRFAALVKRGRKALVPFMTAGDPSPEWTVPLMHTAVVAGADLIELGVPFSDPTADGPVIQASSERAIKRGVNLHGILAMVSEFREQDEETPVILMGYMNPVERFGPAGFAEQAASCGVDGLLLVDCPPEEMGQIRAHLVDQGIHSICLIAPTTTRRRCEKIVQFAGGFLYYVSFKGITGAGRLDASTLQEPVNGLRELTTLPVLVGFGIKDAQSARACAEVADGVVIGSALVSALCEAGNEQDALSAASDFLAPIRRAMDNTACGHTLQG